MEKALKNAGFEVIRKDNLDQQGMKLALVEFSRKLKQGAEAGMFYYAGHGIEVDGKNYLVPIDSNMQSKEEADVYNFDVNSFLAMMENSGVPFNIMVLDACRNNPFRGIRATGGGLAPMRTPVGSYVAYATAPGSVAADGEGANSPFTAALAASMAMPGLSLEEVFKQARTKVRAATGGAQVPFDSSAIEGTFYFLAPSQAEQIPPSTAPVFPSVDKAIAAEKVFDVNGKLFENGAELENVRLYFKLNQPVVLYQVQSLLKVAGSYEGIADGKWGPKTETTFRSLIDTYIAIGGNGADWGINSAADTRRFLSWVADAGYATATGGEFPD